MEIELLTTKKKLTKAIIRQLEHGTTGDIQSFISRNYIGFYVRDMGKGHTERLGLFEGTTGAWKKLNIYSWRKDTCGFGLNCYGNRLKSFKNIKDRDEWLEDYNKATNRMLKNHVII